MLTLYHKYFMVIPYQQSDTMSTSKEEGERVEVVEVPDQTYSECQCTQKEHCTRFREIMESWKFSDPKEHKKVFKDWIDDNDISLTKKFCNSNKKPQSVLKTALAIPSGCNLIEDQLDSLMEYDNDNPWSPSVRIKIGNGMLFEKGKAGDQSRILKELLSVRNKTLGKSRDALTALIKHPVMVIFLCEKWQKVYLYFFIHLRYWMLFLLAYSLFLRIDINNQLLRKDFEARVENTNISICRKNQLGETCYEVFNSICNNTQQLNTTRFMKLNESRNDIIICNPDVWPHDMSRITFLCLGVFFVLLL